MKRRMKMGTKDGTCVRIDSLRPGDIFVVFDSNPRVALHVFSREVSPFGTFLDGEEVEIMFVHEYGRLMSWVYRRTLLVQVL